MISRQWSGIARHADAERYLAHLERDTIPKLAAIPGFLGVTIFRRVVSDGVKFRIVTRWESLEAIGRFAGPNLEQAVVPADVRAMMVTFDQTVEHYEIVEIDNIDSVE